MINASAIEVSVSTVLEISIYFIGTRVMRLIAPNEICLSASEIANRFAGLSGVDLHPTNVGNAAKKLDLDYIELELESSSDEPWLNKQKRYAEADLPLIYEKLWALVKSRSQYL